MNFQSLVSLRIHCIVYQGDRISPSCKQGLHIFQIIILLQPLVGKMTFLSKGQWTCGPTYCPLIDTHIGSKVYKVVYFWVFLNKKHPKKGVFYVPRWHATIFCPPLQFVACQDHPALVKQVDYWPVAAWSPGGSLETPPCWHATNA